MRSGIPSVSVTAKCHDRCPVPEHAKLRVAKRGSVVSDRMDENGIPTRLRALERRAGRMEVDLAVIKSELRSVQDDAAELMKVIRSNQGRIIAVLGTLTAALIGAVVLLALALKP